MSCKTALYAANTAPQATTTAGTTLNFGSIVRRFGCGLNLNGGNVEVNCAGYYNVLVNVTLVSTAAGTATIQIYNDGVAVPGAEATADLSATDTISLTIPAVIRETCNCNATLTVMASGLALSVTNAAIAVERV